MSDEFLNTVVKEILNEIACSYYERHNILFVDTGHKAKCNIAVINIFTKGKSILTKDTENPSKKIFLEYKIDDEWLISDLSEFATMIYCLKKIFY